MNQQTLKALGKLWLVTTTMGRLVIRCAIGNWALVATTANSNTTTLSGFVSRPLCLSSQVRWETLCSACRELVVVPAAEIRRKGSTSGCFFPLAPGCICTSHCGSPDGCYQRKASFVLHANYMLSCLLSLISSWDTVLLCKPIWALLCFYSDRIACVH